LCYGGTIACVAFIERSCGSNCGLIAHFCPGRRCYNFHPGDAILYSLRHALALDGSTNKQERDDVEKHVRLPDVDKCDESSQSESDGNHRQRVIQVDQRRLKLISMFRATST